VAVIGFDGFSFDGEDGDLEFLDEGSGDIVLRGEWI
jgi:hypothetical protein